MSEFVTIKDALSGDGEHIDEDFFKHICLSNGSFKTTAPDRLNDVNDALLPFLKGKERLSILDVAVSSAVSSLEWRTHLDVHDIDCTLTAGDLTMCVHHWSVFGFDFLFEKQTGLLLQCDVFGRAFPSSSGRRWRNLGYKILKILSRPFANFGEIIYLANRDAVSCANSRDDFDLIELDIFQAQAQLGARKFDVVRAANILNRSYFSDDALQKAIRALHGVLHDGGILVVVRSSEFNKNNGSIYRKSGDQFEHVQDIGQKSDIHDIVCNV